jgi:hypothetical protein
MNLIKVSVTWGITSLLKEISPRDSSGGNKGVKRVGVTSGVEILGN